MDFLNKLDNGAVNKETFYMDFITELNNALSNVKNKHSKKFSDAT